MAEKLSVSVVTPLASATRKEVESVTVPTKMGEVTVLPHHIPLISQLDAGVVTLRTSEGVDLYAVSGGFLEVERGNVLVLADTAERPEQIDLAQCESEIKESMEALQRLDGFAPEYAEAQASIKRNEVRIRVAGS